MTVPTNYPTPTLDQSIAFDMDVDAPIYHQRTIARLTAGLYPLFRSGAIAFEPLPETMVGEYSSPTPDLVLYDNATDTAKGIIEIGQTRGLKADLQKVIQEGFVYDYKTQEWLRYHLGDGGVTTSSSFSTVLGLDLNAFLV